MTNLFHNSSADSHHAGNIFHTKQTDIPLFYQHHIFHDISVIQLLQYHQSVDKTLYFSVRVHSLSCDGILSFLYLPKYQYDNISYIPLLCSQNVPEEPEPHFPVKQNQWSSHTFSQILPPFDLPKYFPVS